MGGRVPRPPHTFLAARVPVAPTLPMVPVSPRGRRPLGTAAASGWALVLLAGFALDPIPVAADGPASCAADAEPAVVGALLNRLEAGRASGTLTAAGTSLNARVALPDFYARRGWTPAWIDGGRPTACAVRIVGQLARAADDGLQPGDYHLELLAPLVTRLANGGGDATDRIDLELLLTDAFLTFGSHLLRGRVNPVTLEPEWLANRRDLDMASALEAALEEGDMDGAVAGFRPPFPEYARLRARRGELRTLAERGGWGTVPSGPTFRPGEDDPRVPALRRRLRASGDLVAGGGADDSTLFDGALAEAVVRFQRRHGLDPDGAVGARTVETLNVPVEDRIRQLEINLERWRWLPEDLGSTHIRVNIADYRVEVRQADSVALAMRAVVGRQYRETPMFSGRMTYLVLAPYWHVPPTIAAVDKLPELKRDPGYLAAQRMTLLTQATNEPVNPAAVDFASLTGPDFNRRYRLRQDPGPGNALGQVKFMFPNRHNVYLHDTPSRELFSRTARAFSSGCIRLERPLELADWLLRDEGWSPQRIREAAGGTRETTVRLSHAVPVHLLYFTSFLDDEGLIHFRPDIYQRDVKVDRALDEGPPGL